VSKTQVKQFSFTGIRFLVFTITRSSIFSLYAINR